MAVRFDASADYLSRTTTLPTATTCTLMCWVYPVAAATFATAVSLGVARLGGAAFYGMGPGVGSSANHFHCFGGNGAPEVYGALTYTTNTWYHMALTVAGTSANQMLGYINGVLDITATATTGVSSNTLLIGTSAGDDAMNGRAAAVKVWGAVLTATEIKAEMQQYVPQRTANLLSWHPLLLHTDTAQFGATWTANGTLTTETGPPIAWSCVTPSTQRAFGGMAAPVLPPLPTVRLQAVAASIL